MPGSKKRVGRPPAGLRGERVSDYPQISLRLPRKVYIDLMSIAHTKRLSQWRIVADAIECYFRQMSPAQQQQARRKAGELRDAPRWVPK